MTLTVTTLSWILPVKYWRGWAEQYPSSALSRRPRSPQFRELGPSTLGEKQNLRPGPQLPHKTGHSAITQAPLPTLLGLWNLTREEKKNLETLLFISFLLFAL